MPLLKNTYQPFFPDPNAPALMSCNGSYCYPVVPGDIVRQQWYQTPCSASLVCDPNFEDYTLGAELITNGTFATNADDWFVNAVEIGSTTCPATVDSWCWNTGKLGHDGTDNNSDMVSQTGMGLIAGNVYKVVYTIQGRTQGSIYVQLGDGVGATQGAIYETNETVTEFLFYNDAQDTISFVPSEDFDGNIDDVSLKLFSITCWSGDYWTYDPDSGSACKTISGASANLINTDTDYIVLGDYYQVSVTVSGYVSGTLQVYVDDGTDSTATNVQAVITGNGTYTYWITALQNGVIAFDPNNDFIGCISDPIVQRLRNDYTFELINAAGDSVDISTQAVYEEDKIVLNLDMGTMYEAGTIDYGCFTISVVDSCLVSGENLVQDPNFANGDFTEWIKNSNSFQYDMSGGQLEFIFEPLSDNPTVVTNGDFAAGSTGWTVGANWVVGVGSATHTPGSTATLSQTITLSTPAVLPDYLWTWWQVVVSGRTAGSFTVTVSTYTSPAIPVNDTVTRVCIPTVGGSVTLAITPTSDFDGTITLIAVHETENNWNAFPLVTNAPNPLYVPGSYSSTFDIVSITGTTANTIGGYLTIEYPPAPAIFRTVGTHNTTFTYTPGTTKTQFVGVFIKDTNTSLGNNYYPGRVVMDNLDIHRIEPFEATYISECLNFQSLFDNTAVVTGYSDQSAFGFDWDIDDFKLQMRVYCRGYNMFIEDEVNIARFGTGDAAVKYAHLEKYWLFTTDFMSESALTALKAMIRCDHFMIGEGVDTDTEYIAKEEDYSPQWTANGSYDLAPITISLRLKDGGMKFNRHT